MTRPLKVLVLSDRFPPEVEGGAEISLHDTLLAMEPSEFDLQVLTFGEAEDTEGRIPVVRLPDFVAWPRRSLCMQTKFTGVTGMAAAALKDLWERPSSVGLVGALALRRALRSPVPHPGSDSIMVSTSAFQQVQLRAVIRAFEPDVIHADNLRSILLLQAISVGSFGRVAMVRDHRFFCSHAHQSMVVADRPCVKCRFGCVEGKSGGRVVRRAMIRNKAFRAQALDTYDEVVTTSRFLAGSVERGLPQRAVTAIGNPHPDLEKIVSATRSAPPVVERSILFSGNFRHEKGAVFFAEALSEFRNIDGLKVTFMGRGPEEDRLKRIVEQVGIADRVSFPGFVGLDELYRRMAYAAVIVAPTLWPEPFGRLPLEAGLVGRPIVASAAGGHLETIIDGETGLLFPIGDRSCFVSVLRRLLDNPEKANALGRSAKSHVIRAFGPDAVAKRLGAVWQQAAKARRSDAY